MNGLGGLLLSEQLEVGVWDVLSQSGSIVTVTKMVVQGVLVQEELGANFAIMGHLIHLSIEVATHFFSHYNIKPNNIYYFGSQSLTKYLDLVLVNMVIQ